MHTMLGRRFVEIENESKHQPNKLCVNQGK